jgi:rhodanese-related sulfurtransferase
LQAALFLLNSGVTNIEVLKGGYDAWKTAGYPLVSKTSS